MLLTRARFTPIISGQSVPDVVNDTLLDPDLTKALCILHYQTPGSLKLHYLRPSSPPRKRKRRRGDWRGQNRSYLKPRTQGGFSLPGQAEALQSALSHTASLSPSLLPFPVSLSSPGFLHWEPVKYNNTRVYSLEHPSRSCPQGFLGRY